MTSRCQFIRQDAELIRCVVCGAIRRHAGDPSTYVRNCKPPARGLGDTIASVLDFIGVPKCRSCADRQAALNRLVPY